MVAVVAAAAVLAAVDAVVVVVVWAACLVAPAASDKFLPHSASILPNFESPCPHLFNSHPRALNGLSTVLATTFPTHSRPVAIAFVMGASHVSAPIAFIAVAICPIPGKQGIAAIATEIANPLNASQKPWSKTVILKAILKLSQTTVVASITFAPAINAAPKPCPPGIIQQIIATIKTIIATTICTTVKTVFTVSRELANTSGYLSPHSFSWSPHHFIASQVAHRLAPPVNGANIQPRAIIII